MPAYNAAKTIKATLKSIPHRSKYKLLVCDDDSLDSTVIVARNLGLEVITRPKNGGYGANQKTLYNTVLSFENADVIIMLHPDNQYDASIIPKMTELIENDTADFVLGNRMFADMAKKGGMPLWKRVTNRTLTTIQSRVYGLSLGEFHSGLRAYRRKVLENIDFNEFSNDFVFDSEMIASAIAQGFRISEVPVQAKYFNDASSVGITRGFKYGVETLKVLWRYKRGYYSKKG